MVHPAHTDRVDQITNGYVFSTHLEIVHPSASSVKTLLVRHDVPAHDEQVIEGIVHGTHRDPGGPQVQVCYYAIANPCIALI